MAASNSSFIFINSKDRIEGSRSNTDFICFLNSFNNYRGDVSVSLESAEFYSLQYPIRTNYNDQFRFNEGVAPATFYTITIPQGNYLGDEIAEKIAELMTAAGTGTYGGFFSDITRMVSLIDTIPNTWSYDSSTLSRSINKYIGFPETNTTIQSGHEGIFPVDLNTDLYVDLICVGWSNDNIHTSMLTDVFHRIPLIGSYGDYIHYKNTDPQDFTIIRNETLQTIHIQLINPNGELYELPQNHEVSISLRFESLS